LFLGQFTRDGDGYIYRRSQKGAAIRVSAGEYQDFVETFTRASKRLRWGFVAGILVLLIAIAVGSVSAGVDVDSTAGSIVLIGPILLSAGIFTWFFTRIYHRPARMLERRVPVSGELSREEFRRRWFTAMRWRTIIGQLGTFLAISIVVLLDHDVLHGQGRLWLLLPALFAMIAVLLVWRKLRYTVPNP
jgi:hypothetical protein